MRPLLAYLVMIAAALVSVSGKFAADLFCAAVVLTAFLFIVFNMWQETERR